MAKQILFDAEAREAIRRGVQKLSRAVVSTLGPRGRNAVLDKGWGGPTITKDGVTVAEEIALENAFENMGAQLVKEVASKTSDQAGDGTTTATLLADAIFAEGLRYITSGANPADLNRGLHKLCEAVVEDLKKAAKPVQHSRNWSPRSPRSPRTTTPRWESSSQTPSRRSDRTGSSRSRRGARRKRR